MPARPISIGDGFLFRLKKYSVGFFHFRPRPAAEETVDPQFFIACEPNVSAPDFCVQSL
jgi:hypothetical protein